MEQTLTPSAFRPAFAKSFGLAGRCEAISLGKESERVTNPLSRLSQISKMEEEPVIETKQTTQLNNPNENTSQHRTANSARGNEQDII